VQIPVSYHYRDVHWLLNKFELHLYGCFVGWSFAVHCVELYYVLSNLYKAVQSCLSGTVVISFLCHMMTFQVFNFTAISYFKAVLNFLLYIYFCFMKLPWAFYCTAIFRLLRSCPDGRQRWRGCVTPVWCAEIGPAAGTTASAPVRAAKVSSGQLFC